MKLDKDLLGGDKYIWGIYFFLITLSAVEIFSASSTLAYRASDYYSPAFRHISYLAFGTLAMLVIQKMTIRAYRYIGYAALCLSSVLLVMVLFTKGVNNASRFIFGFQPSEIAKFGLIVYVSSTLSWGYDKTTGVSNAAFKRVLIVSGVICFFILPENFSTAALLGLVVYTLMILAKVPWKKIMILTLVIAGVLVSAYLTIRYTPDKILAKVPGRALTWKHRLESGSSVPLYEEPINDKNMQVQYGRMAVANSKGIGRLFGNSLIRDYLPQAYSDYIFSIIIEETGLLGAAAVMFLYIFLLIRVLYIFRKSNDLFPQLLMMGLALIIVYQALINMSVGVDLGPVTGQPLPLLSRGGTSTMLTCVYFGVIIGISGRIMEKEAYENEEMGGHTVSEEQFEQARDEAIEQDEANRKLEAQRIAAEKQAEAERQRIEMIRMQREAEVKRQEEEARKAQEEEEMREAQRRKNKPEILIEEVKMDNE